MTSLGAGVDVAYRVAMGQPGLQFLGPSVGFHLALAITAVSLQKKKKGVW